MDYLTKEGKDKDVNIVVVTDHFTRFSQALVTLNQMAAITAKTMGALFCVLWHL